MFLPSSPCADHVNSGGGGVTEIFRLLHVRTNLNSVRGGGSTRIFFPSLEVKINQIRSLSSDTFFDISGSPGDHPPFMDTYAFKQRNNNRFIGEKNIYLKFGGGHGPRGAPLATPRNPPKVASRAAGGLGAL